MLWRENTIQERYNFSTTGVKKTKHFALAPTSLRQMSDDNHSWFHSIINTSKG